MYFFNVAGACAIAGKMSRKIERYQTLLRAWQILLIRLPTKQKIMAIKASPLPPDAKSRMIPSRRHRCIRDAKGKLCDSRKGNCLHDDC